MKIEEKSLVRIDRLNLPRSSVPATTHVNYSARIQTIHQDTNSYCHVVISKFKDKTSCPLVINISFNVRRETIICAQTDAFKSFLGTELDIIAIGNYLLIKVIKTKI